MEPSRDLCSNCGMCCDGTLFPYFEIKNDEQALFSQTSSLSPSVNILIPQSCEHFESCTGCKIYEKRPKVCSIYKCPVLLKFEGGELSFDDALGHINSIKNENPLSKEKKSEFLQGSMLK